MKDFPNVVPRALVGGPLAALLALGALLVLGGCGAGHDADCLKSNGAVVVQRRPISRQLKQLLVYDNVDVTIVPDTASYAEVRAGENVIDNIEFSTPAGPGQLVIRNTSRCNWVRSYNTPREVRLHLPYLREVEQHGYGLLSTASQWAQDTLYVRVLSAGDVNLNVQATYLYVDSYDAGDLTLSGFAHDFHPNLGANGFLFASALQTDFCYFFTYPAWVGDAHVRTHGNLGGTLGGSGTLYYSGPPSYIDVIGPNKKRLVAE
ncbi:MAG: GIN domain-containing protein [Janthinobacterium lividum]